MANTFDFDLYMNQWLKVASNGNIWYDRAVAVPFRMRMECRKCGALYHGDVPDNPHTIDADMMVFVKEHSHRADAEKTATYYKEKPPSLTDVSKYGLPYGVPFKPNPADMFQSFNKKKAEDALIEQQLAAYKKEAEAKKAELFDYAKKIEALTDLKTDAEKTPKLTQAWKVLEAYQKQQEEAKNAELLGWFTHKPAPPEPEKEKPLKISTGRRFR